MRSDEAEIQPDPTVMLMDDVLDDIARGNLRVPLFQRPFVWRPEQMLSLFDSIERGYPIGSLLLWQTDEPVQSLGKVGGLEVPAPVPGRQISYVLDGHQRLSTLYGVLRRRSLPLTDDPKDWVWRIYRDLRDRSSEERYRHHRPPRVPEYLLPLWVVSKTLDFLRFSRELETRVKDLDRLTELVREADAVTQRLKSYKLTVIRLRGASLHQAVEVYTRLNRRGTRMAADQMVSALTHRSEQPTLAQRIDDIISLVAGMVSSKTGTAFGEVPREAVFRSVLAVAGEQDIMSPRWETVAGRMQNKLRDAVPKTERAVVRAVRFLQDKIDVPLAKLLPYSHQLVLLAMFFHHRPEPTRKQVEKLRRWFWVTSWTSAFGGVTSTMLRHALKNMRAFAGLKGDLGPDVINVQPLPESFNMNSARTKAYVIWELQALPDRLDSLGQPFDAVKLLASGDGQSYRPVVAGDKRPANRLIMPTRSDVRLIDALRNLGMSGRQLRPNQVPGSWVALMEGRLSEEDQVSPRERILRSHGIPIKAWRGLCEGGGGQDIFVKDRTEFLEGQLRAFAAKIGVQLGDQIEGVADDDSDE